MKKTTIILTLLTFLFKGLTAQVNTLSFYYNGISTASKGWDSGSIQTWTVPPCVTVITVTAAGASGGITINAPTPNLPGGVGAILTGTVTVVPGHLLNILVAGRGQDNQQNDGSGGGGGSFLWDNNTTTLLVAAGGGGGAGSWSGSVQGGPGANAQITNTSPAALAAPTFSSGGSCAPGGVNGGGGQAGLTTLGGPDTSSNGGPACGGAGWLHNGRNVGPHMSGGTNYFYAHGYGVYPDSSVTPGFGGNYFDIGQGGAGGYGGGAGGGFNGGGGAGGYNGGGGANGQANPTGWGGGGGGSYFNADTAMFISLGQPDSNGYVIITWQVSDSSGTPPAITVSGTSNVTCNGLNNGSATIAVTGSTPFTYSWTPIGGNGATATGLSAGSYTITVSNLDCSASATVIITEPATLTANVTGNNAIACANNGNATINISGGTTPYTYNWSNGNTNAAITGLPGGSYFVTVTDSNGCTTSANIAINQPPPLSAIITAKSNIPCNGGNKGSATVTPSGGTLPYTYNWTNTETNPTDTGLSAGTYTVIITDSNNCATTTTVNITQPAPLTASITSAGKILCSGSDSGSAAVTALGGTLPYTYSWSGGNTNQEVTGLSGGLYKVTVTDSNHCKTVTTTTITIDLPTINACCNKVVFSGDDTILTANGNKIKSYSWMPSTGLSCDSCATTIATPTATTTYTVIATDSIGCQIEDVITITVETPCLDFTVPNVITPGNKGMLGLDDVLYIKTLNINGWSLTIYDRWGKEVYNSSNVNEFWNGTTQSGEQVPEGVYYYIISATCQNNTYKKDGFIQVIR